MRALRRSDVARALLSVVGVLVALTGVVALIGSSLAFQGEELLLLIAGIALLAFGVMIVFRWNLRAVKTGLAGMTAGYFASALTSSRWRQTRATSAQPWSAARATSPEALPGLSTRGQWSWPCCFSLSSRWSRTSRRRGNPTEVHRPRPAST